MSGGSGLCDVSTTSLVRLRDGLRGGQLRAPFTRSDLVAFGVKEQLPAVLAALEGHPGAACLSVIEAVLAERTKHDLPAPELVWTGPEAQHAGARDTAVVLRELFESARHRVVLAGYSFWNAKAVLGPLHAVMQGRGVRAHFFVDVEQVKRAPPDAEAQAQAALGSFIRESWPFGSPFPELFCDRRAFSPGPPWASLHAKCVAVDGERALVSSANFTLAGQERNIEAGVLLHDAAFASQLEKQLMGLVSAGHVVRWKG